MRLVITLSSTDPVYFHLTKLPVTSQFFLSLRHPAQPPAASGDEAQPKIVPWQAVATGPSGLCESIFSQVHTRLTHSVRSHNSAL